MNKDKDLINENTPLEEETEAATEENTAVAEPEVTEETAAKLTEMGHGEIKTAASGAMQSIMFMDDGNIAEDAAPAELFTNPKNQHLRDFLGKVLK